MIKAEQRNFTIDVFRLIGALSVVALHVPYADLSNNLVLGIRWWGRWAVPFFFLLSGYFFQTNYAARGEVQFAKTIKNLVAIYIISNSVYIIVYALIQKVPFSQLLNFNTLDNGVSEHLWFVGSMLFGYLIILYLLNRFSDNVLIIGSSILYIFISFLDAYSGFFHVYLSYDFVRYFISIPFLLWGFLLSKKNKLLAGIPLELIIVAVPVLFILQGIEIIFIYRKTGFSPHNQEFVLLTSFFALAMFLVAIKVRLDSDTILSKWGRDYSLLIYLYHPLLNLFLFKIIDVYNLGGGYLMLFNPLISFSFCLCFFITINKIFPAFIKILGGL